MTVIVCHFKADSDSPLARARVHLLRPCVHGGTAADAKTADITVLDQLGVTRNLTPTRLNGLAAVRARITTLASRET